MSAVSILDVTLWSPDDDCEGQTVAFAEGATASFHVNAYGFSYAPLMDALIAAHGRGVHVACLCDHTQAAGRSERPQLQRLVDAGIEVVITASRTGAIDHEKVLIRDGELGAAHPSSCVLFGSFNFSLSAQQQDNYIALRNDAGLVARYLANWQEIYAQPRHPDWQLAPHA